MTISIDWPAKLVLSTASILDIVALKDTLRDFEDGDAGMLNAPIISYKRLDLGGGAYFHGVDFINGYQLKFPNAGNYTIIGNIGAGIVPVAGVFVDRVKSAAFATVAGGAVPTAADNAAAVWQSLVEGGLSAEQVLRVLLSALAGKSTGTGSTTEQYHSQDGSKARLTATFDAAGNRSGVVVDGS